MRALFCTLQLEVAKSSNLFKAALRGILIFGLQLEKCCGADGLKVVENLLRRNQIMSGDDTKSTLFFAVVMNYESKMVLD